MLESEGILDIRNVSLLRGDKAILSDVSWHVRRGEHWAVVGANGSGKTSLLKVATGYFWPSEGSVTVLGRRFGQVDLRKLRRRIGWVSSALTDRIPPSQTAVRIVLSGPFASLGLFEETTDRQRNRAMDLLDQMGCAETADRRFAVLSAGERQKTLIARALLAEPDILILDEACAGLDVAARENLLETVERLCRNDEGKTLVFVTHHIEEIPPLISHALVLKGGKVLAAGPKRGTLTGGLLSEALSVSLKVESHNGRFSTKVGQAGAMP